MRSSSKSSKGAAEILLQTDAEEREGSSNSPRNPWLKPGPSQPVREFLPQIPCRCSKRETAAQPAVAAPHRSGGMRRWLIRGGIAVVAIPVLWYFASRWCALAVDQLH